MTTLKQLLLSTKENLQTLQEREAKYGGNAPLELISQIKDHQQAISLLEAARAAEPTEKDLAELKKELRPLLIADNIEAVDLDDLKPEIPPLPYEPATILIPAGPCVMGSDPGDGVLPEETPAHTVELPAYYLGQYPVTHEQYAAFIDERMTQEPPKRAGWSLQREPPAARLDHPVVGVSWHDAVAYCQWLSEVTGRLYRLPTEAEWEKAARGPEGHIYPWGNKWAAKNCNHAGEDTTPVTAYPAGASPYGCVDMIGNVQEWVSTAWGSNPNVNRFGYPYQATDGREDADDGHTSLFRIHRGRSFRDEPGLLRCPVRGCASPHSKVRWRGFRVAREG